jgi:hypothetical protein
MIYYFKEATPALEVFQMIGTLGVYHAEKPPFCPFSVVSLQVVSRNN